MSKLRLPLFLLLLASVPFIIQSCNKDSLVGVAYTTAPFQANVDGNAWVPATDSSSFGISYNTVASTKTFLLQGTRQAKQVIFSVTLPNTNTTGFPLGTYTIDGSAINAQFNIQTSAGAPFTQHGTVEPGAGTLKVTAVDSVKKQITGTFAFYSRTTNYDTDGNVISITVDNITGGEFTRVPYTLTTN